jgi:hypothetical protein
MNDTSLFQRVLKQESDMNIRRTYIVQACILCIHKKNAVFLQKLVNNFKNILDFNMFHIASISSWPMEKTVFDILTTTYKDHQVYGLLCMYQSKNK